MYRATLILTVLFFVSSLDAGKTSFASEASSSVATETNISSPIEPSQGRNLLRQLAIALAAGGEALSQFRGPTMKTEDGENFFSPAMPGMDCGINGIANYVSCYGSAIGNQDEADRRFIRLIHELQAVLPSDRWRGIETDPHRYRLDYDHGDGSRRYVPRSHFRVARHGATIVMRMVVFSILPADISAFVCIPTRHSY